MDKIITVTSHTNTLEKGEKFMETEYPQLNKYLEQGYVVINTYPIIKPADASYMYSIVFHLRSL